MYIIFEIAIALLFTGISYCHLSEFLIRFLLGIAIPCLIFGEFFRNIFNLVKFGVWTKFFVKGAYLFSLCLGFIYAIYFRGDNDYAMLFDFYRINLIGYVVFSWAWWFFNKNSQENKILKFFSRIDVSNCSRQSITLIALSFGILGVAMAYGLFVKYHDFPIFDPNPSVARYLYFNGPFTHSLTRYLFRASILSILIGMMISVYQIHIRKEFSIITAVNFFNILAGLSAVIIGGLRGEIIFLFMFNIALIFSKKEIFLKKFGQIVLVGILYVAVIMSVTALRQLPYMKESFRQKEKLNHQLLVETQFKEGGQLQRSARISLPTPDSSSLRKDEKIFIISSSVLYMLAPEVTENSILLRYFYRENNPFLKGYSYLSDILNFLPSSIFQFRNKYEIGRWSLALKGTTTREQDPSCGGMRVGCVLRAFFNFGYIGVIFVMMIWGVMAAQLFSSNSSISNSFLFCGLLVLLQHLFIAGESYLIIGYALLFAVFLIHMANSLMVKND